MKFSNMICNLSALCSKKREYAWRREKLRGAFLSYKSYEAKFSTNNHVKKFILFEETIQNVKYSSD